MGRLCIQLHTHQPKHRPDVHGEETLYGVVDVLRDILLRGLLLANNFVRECEIFFLLQWVIYFFLFYI